MTMTPAPEYCFAVQDTRGDAFELEIHPHDERAKSHFQSVWQRLSATVEAMHKLEQQPLPGWAKWQPWKWCDDKSMAHQPRQKFVAWCGSNQAGFLNVWAGHDSAHESGKKTLYIEHVGVAPGNLDTVLWSRRYKKVGTALMAYAVKLSREQGFDGRLALHAADDAALGFYRVLNRMTGGLFHPEQKGIVGPTPHGPRNDPALTYLETTVVGAERLLEGYRRA